MRPARFVGFLVLSATSPARFLGTEAVAARCSELTESERRAYQRELLELRANHEKTVHELQMQLDSRTAELERLRHEGCRCSQPATHRSIESSHDPTAPATAVSVHGALTTVNWATVLALLLVVYTSSTTNTQIPIY